MRITLNLHGSLRDMAGVSEGPYEVEAGCTVAALLDRLGLGPTAQTVVAVVDQRTAPPGRVLPPGAEVHLFLKICGG